MKNLVLLWFCSNFGLHMFQKILRILKKIIQLFQDFFFLLECSETYFCFSHEQNQSKNIVCPKIFNRIFVLVGCIPPKPSVHSLPCQHPPLREALNGRTVNALVCWPRVRGSSPSLGKTPTIKNRHSIAGTSVTCMKSLAVQ